MNQDLYRPFGDHFSAKADDFKASESYRWVRLGIRLLMIGYVLLLPAVAAIAFLVAQEKGLQVPDLPPQYLINRYCCHSGQSLAWLASDRYCQANCNGVWKLLLVGVLSGAG